MSDNYYCALISNEDGTISWAPGVEESILAARAEREEKDNYPLFPIEAVLGEDHPGK